jgi:hypothetical protein
MLDFDLASIYGVETKSLNRAVKRNADRFPERFYVSSHSPGVRLFDIAKCDVKAEELIANCDIKMPAAAGVGRGLTPLLSTAHWLSCIRHDDPRENIGAPRRVQNQAQSDLRQAAERRLPLWLARSWPRRA